MKFAVAALIATTQAAGWKGDGAVIASGPVQPVLVGASGRLGLGAGLNGQVLIDSGVDNNLVDAQRFA